MAAAIKLTVITGPHKTDRYCFRDKTTCEIGRAPECMVELAGFPRDGQISRHHCQLSIDPPSITVRDLDSTNGSFVNGHPVSLEGELTLRDGDVLTVGGTTLTVNVIDCPFLIGTQPERAEGEEEAAGDAPHCNGDCLLAGRAHLLSDGVTVLWKVSSPGAVPTPHA